MLLTKLAVNNSVKLDFLHLEEASSNNTDIFSIPKYKPTLNNDSRFLATFDNATTIARGIADVALGYNFSVYREVNNTNQLKYIARLGDGALTMTDYNVVNNTTYKYYIFKEDESAISEAVASNSITTCWWDWSLIDLVPSTTEKGLYYANPNAIWKFNLNISSGGVSQNVNNTTYNNLTRFPKISSGKLNYASGTLTCLLGDVQNTNDGQIGYVESAALLESWNDFCANGNIKLLKDRKGNAMLVMITSTSSQVDDVLREQANTITFSWTQIADVSSITIIGA